MTRYRAAATYLMATGVVAAAVFLPIYFFWYPGALFEQAGGRELFALIVGVDLVAGPLLVFLVYKPGKRGLKFDLAVIAALQLSALSYGAYVLFESRPVFIVFAKDRFELVRANDLADQDLAEARPGPFATRPWTGPRVVGTRFPKDPGEQLRLMDSALFGKDIQLMPKYYADYSDATAQVLARAQPISRLRTLNPSAGPRIDRLVKRSGRAEEELRFLPMRAGPVVDVTVLVDARTAAVLDIVALKPWEYQ